MDLAGNLTAHHWYPIALVVTALLCTWVGGKLKTGNPPLAPAQQSPLFGAGRNMGKLRVFNFVTLNGCYKGPHGDIDWHRHGTEETGFSAESLKADNILLFGRVTYEMMARYWPSPDAIKNNPVVAEGMNKAEKIVFSRTLKRAGWNNTRIVKDSILDEVSKMKQISPKDLTILGSGSIAAKLADAGLIDEYQIMVDPVVIGGGTPLFSSITCKLDLRLTGTRTFKSGVVLLFYKPMRE